MATRSLGTARHGRSPDTISPPRPGTARAPLGFDPIAEARRHWEAHGWAGAAGGMAVVTSIVRVQQLVLTRIERILRPLGLTFARYELLMLLSFSRHGALPLGKIGARLQVHAGAVTNAVDRLEADRLVVRRAHDTDGRATLAAITAKGRRLASRATEMLNREVFEAFPLAADQQAELVALLREVRRDAGDFEPSPDRDREQRATER